ncbi:ABC transporter permease [Sinimarinibacterium flocculans]|uniref:Putative ABC transport system permease protein n=1 Tax=Sinimarinibacterium flocculans TaxID=985250 RepID=A0A318EDG3_9GAMM|nr:FtsX-like permease family protein [Sinimarinibacterium flocculans]PXV67774.1 putative ABC transport system permease protein [Sinimarinibacterium flocculans]
MANTLNQIGAVTALNVRSIPSRLGTSLVIVIGIAGVVGVLVALLSMGAGFAATLGGTGTEERTIVLRGGSVDELSSVITREQSQIIGDAPGVARDADGKPVMVAEFYLLTDVAKPDSTSPNNVVVRGTQSDVARVRPEFGIVEGRMFESGVREVIIGTGVARQFETLQLGGTVDVRDGAWNIVGIFETGGDVHESELWVDAGALETASRRSAFNSVTLQLESADAFQTFKDALTTDPRLVVNPQRQTDYYASRSEQLHMLIRILGYTVAVIMGIGAVFGALNVMYAAVATRTVEIATLRALGFGGLPVVISVMIESLLLALAGGLVGALGAYLFFNGFTVNTLNFQTFSQVAFAFQVTPELIRQGIVWALVMGLIGGLFPAVRAARLPVVDALRAG